MSQKTTVQSKRPRKAPSNQTGGTAWGKKAAAAISGKMQSADVKKLILLNFPYIIAFYMVEKAAWLYRYCNGDTIVDRLMVLFTHYRHDEFVEVSDEVWEAMRQAQREMNNYERRKVYHRAWYSLDAYSWTENYALEHGRSPEDILVEREEMTTRLRLIAALPAALAHATPTQARRVHAYYIAGIKQPEISRIEGVHSSKVSVAIRRGLRNMRRCYDGLFQTE